MKEKIGGNEESVSTGMESCPSPGSRTQPQENMKHRVFHLAINARDRAWIEKHPVRAGDAS